MKPDEYPIYRKNVTPSEWYECFRWLDRVFAKQTEYHEGIIASFDLSRVGHSEQYLMKHLLILQRRYNIVLTSHPNLRPLIRVESIDEPIVMSDNPRHGWKYFRDKGIWL